MLFFNIIIIFIIYILLLYFFNIIIQYHSVFQWPSCTFIRLFFQLRRFSETSRPLIRTFFSNFFSRLVALFVSQACQFTFSRTA